MPVLFKIKLSSCYPEQAPSRIGYKYTAIKGVIIARKYSIFQACWPIWE